MRFLAFDAALAGAGRTARRFPAPIISGLIGGAAAIALIESRSSGQRDQLEFLLTAILGIPIFTAVTLVGVRIGGPGRAARMPLLLGIGLVVLFYALIRNAPDQQLWIRFFHWALAAHLAVAVGPFLWAGSARALWQFNRIVLQRFLLAGVYSGVLFVGLALALGAIDRLLGVSVPSETYPELFAILALGFNTWFFLAGVPEELDRLEQVDDFPLGLKIFAQYVLVPLATVYLVIVLLYLGRVVITRTWPSGWIGYLVSGVSVTGTLAILLIHPVRGSAVYRWVDGYARWYFVVLIPALVMALLAVGKRIGQYGITEPRYALVVLAGWLLFVALYYVITRSRSIRLIPASLGLVSVLTAFGPWGIFSVARRSQINRLNGLLERNALVADGTGPATAEPPALVAREINAVLRYLTDRHGPAVMARAIGVPADSAKAWPEQYEGVRLALARLDVSDDYLTVTDSPWRSFNLYGAVVDTAVAAGVELDGGGRAYVQRYLMTPFRVAVAGDTLAFRPDRGAGAIEVLRRDSVLTRLDLTAALEPALQAPGDPSAGRLGRPEPVVVTGSIDRHLIRLLITEASWSLRQSDSLSRNVTATVIVTPK